MAFSHLLLFLFLRAREIKSRYSLGAKGEREEERDSETFIPGNTGKDSPQFISREHAKNCRFPPSAWAGRNYV